MTKRRTLRAVVLLLALGTVVTACARPENPDPGNRLLKALAADPVFAKLPHHAVRTSWQKIPAKYRGDNPFAGGNNIWDGPRVTLTFTSSLSVRDVYRFYAQLADHAGWMSYRRRSPGFTGSWRKRTSTELSSLGLIPNFNVHYVNLAKGGTPRDYTLGSSITRLPKNGQ